MQVIGKFLVLMGLLISALGVLVLLSDRIGFLGHLPLDIKIERKNFFFYFPLGTCIILSIIATLILALMGRR